MDAFTLGPNGCYSSYWCAPILTLWRVQSGFGSRDQCADGGSPLVNPARH
jgi:hypothetical protein